MGKALADALARALAAGDALAARIALAAVSGLVDGGARVALVRCTKDR
jgi:hypothetical protein